KLARELGPTGTSGQPKGQQHVAWPPTRQAARSRAHVHHAVHYDRTGTIHTASPGLHAVDRVEVPVGIEAPEDRAVFGGIGAQSSIHPTAQHGAWYDRNRTALPGVTVVSEATEPGLGRFIPNEMSVRQR